MLLNANTQSIQVSIQGAPQTTQPTVVAEFADITTTTFLAAPQRTTLNGATPVQVVDPPAASTQRKVKELIIANVDTQANTFLVEFVDGAGRSQVVKEIVQPGKVLMYIDGYGWTNGFQQQGPQGPAGPAGASYIHTQASAASTWAINHNLGFQPDITLFSAGGVVFDGQIIHLNNNQAQAVLDTATTGTARCE